MGGKVKWAPKSMLFWIRYGSGPFVIVGLWDFCAHLTVSKTHIPII